MGWLTGILPFAAIGACCALPVLGAVAVRLWRSGGDRAQGGVQRTEELSAPTARREG